MRKEQSSATAEGMALVRSIEAQRPEDRRICYDPIACSLINPIARFLSKLVIHSGIHNFLGTPGTMAYILARERYIDDFLNASLIEGLDQIVILGAGFDTRAYRIPTIEKTHVFEVDHPDTQVVKLERLKKIIDPLPDHVTFVAVDFNSQMLGERLKASGYNESDKTLFILQGVTMYLTPEGVDTTLEFIADHSKPGSLVIFDYFYTETLQEMKNTQWITGMIGEKYTFGIDRGKLELFLTSRGFSDIRCMDTEELKRFYFTGPNAGRVMSKGAAIASARVNNAIE